jgi:hypothetical protein
MLKQNQRRPVGATLSMNLAAGQVRDHRPRKSLARRLGRRLGKDMGLRPRQGRKGIVAERTPRAGSPKHRKAG